LGAGVPLPGALWRGVIVPLALIFVWAIVADTGIVHSRLLVPVERVVAIAFTDEAGREVWLALGASLVRMILGFVLGAAAGTALGFLLGMSRTADCTVGPSFHAVRQITLFAWIPLLTAWFGSGEGAKIVYIALSAFFPMVLYTQEGLRNIPVHYREVAHVMRFSWRKRITRLLLPGALPAIFVGIQIALITAWIGTVGAEYAMGMGRGLGTFLSEGREQFRMDIVLLGVVVLALVGYGTNVACRVVFRRLLYWQGDGR
jgi:sulfonate transport system permease protein